jgi:hypothetical protein
MITPTQPQLDPKQKIKIMKSRNPIRRNETMTPPALTNCNREFRIQISEIENCEVTSIDKRKIYGLPSVYVSINNGMIVGLTNVFRTDTDKMKYYLPDVPSTRNNASIQFSHDYNRDSLFELNNSHPTQNIRLSTYSSDSLPISEQLAKKIERRIFSDTGLDTKRALQISFTELFQATVKEAMSLNWLLNFPKWSYDDLHENPLPLLEDDCPESMFRCSLIYRKKLWWINLLSKEVIANEFGILYKGQYYMPLEDRDIFVLRKLVTRKHTTSVTIYSHPETPHLVHWVFENRMILLHANGRQKHSLLKHIQNESLTNFFQL